MRHHSKTLRLSEWPAGNLGKDKGGHLVESYIELGTLPSTY